MEDSYHSPVLGDLPAEIEIDRRRVGAGHPCYIIAEVGSNHDRDLSRALRFVDAAAAAGCDAVKFQTFSGPDIASSYVSELTRLPPEFARWGANLQEFYRNFALPAEFHKPLIERASERGISFFSSPFSEPAVDILAELKVPALKIASFEIVHLPLIQYAAATGIPLIISTGMAGYGDIERALEAAQKGGARQVALLHCGSNYPLGPAGAHLNAMETLRRAFGVPVGYSDHTLGATVPIAVGALGGSLLEKHVTLPDGTSPDHSFAVDAGAELRSLVESVRVAEMAIGNSIKRRQEQEEEHAVRGRRSIFAAREIDAGEKLDQTGIKIVRPGIGLEPIFLSLILGRTLVKSIAGDQPLTWEHFLSPRSG